MDNTQIVGFLRYGGYTCLVLAALFLALSIWLFFKLDVRGLMDELSGKARKTAIEKKSQDYEITGTLRTVSDDISEKPKTSGKMKKKSKKPSSSSGKTNSGKTNSGKTNSGGIKQEPKPKSGNMQQQKPKSGNIQQPIPETTVMRQNNAQTVRNNKKFQITKEVILIHTEEKI